MPTSLNDLNDDCLLVIFDFLSTRDQIIVSQVCIRFRYLIENEWNFKGKFQSLSLTEYFWKSSKIEAYFPKFIRSVSLGAIDVNSIELNAYHLERWSGLLRRLQFSNITACTAHVSNDEQLILIAEYFPNVTKFTLRGRATGKYLWNLRNLTELHLDVHDIKFKTETLKRLYKKLQLKKVKIYSEDRKSSYGLSKAISPLFHCDKIEELQIVGDIVHTTVKNIKKIKSLRKLTVGLILSFRFIPYPLEDIGGHLGTEIESLIFNHVIKDRADLLKGIERMINLRKFVMYDDSITYEQFRHISIHLRNLEEFHYLKSGRINEDVEKFLPLITNCMKLKVLDVSGTSVDAKLLLEISKLIVKQDRAQTLVLRCCDTKITKENVQNLNLPENLIISFEKYNIDLPDEYFFQVIFNR